MTSAAGGPPRSPDSCGRAACRAPGARRVFAPREVRRVATTSSASGTGGGQGGRRVGTRRQCPARPSCRARRASTRCIRQRRYPPELQERAVRLVLERIEQAGERQGAVSRVARQLGHRHRVAACLGAPGRDRGPPPSRADQRGAGPDERARAGEPRAADRRVPHLVRGVEPICRTLAVAPSSYYAAKTRPPSARSLNDASVNQAGHRARPPGELRGVRGAQGLTRPAPAGRRGRARPGPPPDARGRPPGGDAHEEDPHHAARGRGHPSGRPRRAGVHGTRAASGRRTRRMSGRCGASAPPPSSSTPFPGGSWAGGCWPACAPSLPSMPW